MFFSYSDGPRKVKDIFRVLYDKVTSGEIKWPDGETVVEKRLSRKRNLNAIEHERTVTWSCDQCEKVFTQNKNLLAHKRNYHSNENVKYQCPACQSKFTLPYDLKYHLRNAHKMTTDIKEMIKYKVQTEGTSR